MRLAGEALGFVFAFANAILFALYIVLGHRVSRTEGLDGIDGLALSMVVALVVSTPIGGWQAVGAFTDPVALAAGIGVGICSSVIPYVSDQLAMARLPRATYSLMVALLPAVATVVGVVVLAQVPTAPEVAGVALVVAAVAVHQERATDESRAPSAPDPAPVLTSSCARSAQSHSSRRVSRGSMISSMPNFSAVRNGERTAFRRSSISARSAAGSSAASRSRR